MISKLKRVQVSSFHRGNSKADSAGTVGVQGISQGPFYSFFNLPVSNQLLGAFEMIDEAIECDGPFDGIMGFSQGASIAAAYLIRDPSDSIPFKCAAFFCGSMPFDVDSAPFRAMDDGKFTDATTGDDVSSEISSTIPELLDRDRYLGLGEMLLLRRYSATGTSQISIPTVHIYASNDPYYTQSTLLAAMCQSFEKETIVHKGGHSVPWDQRITAQIIEGIRRMVHAAQLQ